MHGDQTGRDGGPKKKVKEGNGPLDDLDQSEDVRGCCQPLLKTDSEAADRISSRTAEGPMCYSDLMGREWNEDENQSCEPPSPSLAAPPDIFKPLGGFF